MAVTLRKYQGGNDWEVDIRVLLPEGTLLRERKKAPMSGHSAALRWGQARERALLVSGKPHAQQEEAQPPTPVTTLRAFAPRFIDGQARANREKPSGIASKESILRVHLIPHLGDTPLDAITTEDIQRLKGTLASRSPKTVNNVLTALNVALKTAVEWGVIDRMPCSIKLLKAPKPTASYYDFDEYERVVEAARQDGRHAQLIALLGGEAGLRCGELMALEWSDVDLLKRQLCVARSEWKGHVTVPKGGRLRYVPLTQRLTAALKHGRHLRTARVVCDDLGKSLTQKVVQVTMRRVARRAKVQAGVHILRHTFCSHLAMRGAPARAIQELAGHQDLGTTQRYMHLSPAALDAAIRLLDHPAIVPARGEILEAAGTGPK